MTIPTIKQIDLEMGRAFEKEWSGLPIRQPLAELLATQRETYEARIAELERERDAFREMAIRHHWNWNLCRAYGAEDYRRQLEEQVDTTLQNMLASTPAARFIQETGRG